MAVRIKKKAAYHHGDLRQTLVDAALRIARDRGTRAITLADTAKLAGVSSAAPYRHFADKEALLAAAAEACFVQFHSVLNTARTSTTNLVEGLFLQGEAYLDFGKQHPEQLDLMFAMHFNFGAYAELLVASANAWDELLASVRALAADGIIDAARADDVARQVWFFTHGAATIGMALPGSPDPARTLRAGVSRLLGLPADAVSASK